MRIPSLQQDDSSLSESWASVSDAGASLDDDERSEQTDLGSLVDVRSAADALSEPDDDESTDDEGQEQDGTPFEIITDEEQEADRRRSSHHDSPAESLTETSLLSESGLLLDEARMPSPHAYTIAKHIMRDLEPHHLLPSERQCLQAGVSHQGTIHANLGKMTLKDSNRQSFHLLLFGKDYISALRNHIVGKIADVLVASASVTDFTPPLATSRYHVVPDCFGPGSIPSAAEAIPIECHLEVDSYHSATMSQQGIFLLNEKTSRRTYSEFDGTSAEIKDPEWKKPDVAFVVVSKDDDAGLRDSACAMLVFAKRHSIPVLIISMEQDWDFDFAPLVFADHGIHRCVELKSGDKQVEIRKLPLDLYTFVDLNAAQFSRHISYLIDVSDPTTEVGGEEKVSSRTKPRGKQSGWLLQTESGGSRIPYLARWRKRPQPSAYLDPGETCLGIFHILLAIFLCTAAAFAFATLQVRFGATTNETAIVPINSSTQLAVSTATSVVSVASVPTIETSTVPLTIDASRSSSGKLEVEVVGNAHLLVRTPHKVKGKGQLEVQVLRSGRVIASEVKMLFPCVYSVRVAPEELHDKIDVYIAMARPRLAETITLELGPEPLVAWLKRLANQVDRSFHQGRRLREPVNLRRKQQDAVESLRELFSTFRTARRPSQAANDLKERLAIQSFRIRGQAARAQMAAYEMIKAGKRALRGGPQLVSDACQRRVGELQQALGGRWCQATRQFSEGVHSETLAAAQGRAQNLVEGLGWKKGKARRMAKDGDAV